MSDEIDRLKEMLSGLTEEGAKVAMELLVKERLLGEQPLEDFRQELFLVRYLENRGNVTRTLRDVGVGRATYNKWLRDGNFVSRMKFAERDQIESLRSTWMEKARENWDTAKFFLQAYDPETFDFRLRAEREKNKGQIDAIKAEAGMLSEDRWRRAVEEDPAQEFVTEEKLH